jgi:segregation and condensation protein B
MKKTADRATKPTRSDAEVTAARIGAQHLGPFRRQRQRVLDKFDHNPERPSVGIRPRKQRPRGADGGAENGLCGGRRALLYPRGREGGKRRADKREAADATQFQQGDGVAGPRTDAAKPSAAVAVPLPFRRRGSGGGELARDARLAAVEAALVAADEPLTAKKLATSAALADAAEARRTVQRLRELYDAVGSAFQVEELAGGFQLLTRPEFHPWLVRLRRGSAEMKISPAARETLTIVAYRQPITRADIEAVRRAVRRGAAATDGEGAVADSRTR